MAPITLKRPVATAAAAFLLITFFAAAPAVTHLVAALLHNLHRVLPAARLPGGMSAASVIVVAVVLFFAGVVSGLAGFAFSAVAACILWLLPPLQAVPLTMLLSACNQLLSISKLRREMTIIGTAEREGALPYILGGLAGAPVGVELLRRLPVSLFTGGLGAFLVVYALVMLLMPGRFRIKQCGSKTTAVAVGALGGVIGGFSGFGASALVVYLGLRGADKSAIRGVTQPFIMVMQLVSLTMLAVVQPAVFDVAFWFLWALTLPAVLVGSNAGVALYRRLSDRNFRRAVLILLIVSGASLVAKSVI